MKDSKFFHSFIGMDLKIKICQFKSVPLNLPFPVTKIAPLVEMYCIGFCDLAISKINSPVTLIAV